MIAQDLVLLYLEISPKGTGDDIVGNSRIPKANLEFPKDEFRISRDCFASLAMTQGILDFILLR